MDEVLALQQELAVVQQSSTTQRLSDRNCVELVMKLQSLRLVDLIFTRSGKEYLTPAQLVLEIRDEILTRGGRVNLTDLPDSLNVALSYIEAALPEILADCSVSIVRGELITDYYLSTLVDEVDDFLSASETGTATIADIATRYSLPVDIIRTTIQSHSSQLHSTFDPETMILTSDSALQRQRAQACGLLRGLTSPMTISEAAESHGLPVAIVASAVHNMIKTASLVGALKGRGSRAVYTPAVYTNAVADTLSTDFSSNGFLLRDTLTRLHISDVDEFVRNYLSRSILLSNCVVSSVWMDTLSTSAADAIVSESWIDVISTLPPGFPENDIPSVVALIAEAVSKIDMKGENVSGEVEHRDTRLEDVGNVKGTRARRKGRRKDNALEGDAVTGKQSQFIVYGERYFVSPIIRTNINRVVELEAKNRAHERARRISERMETVGLTTEVIYGGRNGIDPHEPPASQKKSKGKGRRRAGGKDKDNVPTDASNGTGSTHESIDNIAVVSIPTLTEILAIIIGDEACAKLAENDYLENGADGEDMIVGVLQQTYGETGLVELFHKTASEAVVELERERTMAKLNSEKRLLGDLSILEVYMRSARTLSHEFSMLSFQYLLDNHSIAVICRVLEMVCKNCGIGGFDTEEIMRNPEKNERLEKLREMASRLPSALEPKAVELIRTVVVREPGESAIEEIFNVYDAVTGVFDLPERRPVDKKAERAVSANLRGQFAESLDATVAMEPSVDVDICARQSLMKTSSILTYARIRPGVIVDFAPVDAEKFAIFIEDLAEVENIQAIRESLGAVRVASFGERKSEDSQDLMEWDVVIRKVMRLREIIG